MKLSNNFSKSEFECKCGCEMPEAVLLEVTRLANELQHIRDFIHKPMNLTNAYRCPERNKEVGGVPNSQHLLGKAADIQIEELEPSEVYKTIDNLTDHGHIVQGGLGKYNTFTHYDIRGTKARWDKTIE